MHQKHFMDYWLIFAWILFLTAADSTLADLAPLHQSSVEVEANRLLKYRDVNPSSSILGSVLSTSNSGNPSNSYGSSHYTIPGSIILPLVPPGTGSSNSGSRSSMQSSSGSGLSKSTASSVSSRPNTSQLAASPGSSVTASHASVTSALSHGPSSSSTPDLVLPQTPISTSGPAASSQAVILGGLMSSFAKQGKDWGHSITVPEIKTKALSDNHHFSVNAVAAFTNLGGEMPPKTDACGEGSGLKNKRDLLNGIKNLAGNAMGLAGCAVNVASDLGKKIDVPPGNTPDFGSIDQSFSGLDQLSQEQEKEKDDDKDKSSSAKKDSSTARKESSTDKKDSSTATSKASTSASSKSASKSSESSSRSSSSSSGSFSLGPVATDGLPGPSPVTADPKKEAELYATLSAEYFADDSSSMPNPSSTMATSRMASTTKLPPSPSSSASPRPSKSTIPTSTSPSPPHSASSTPTTPPSATPSLQPSATAGFNPATTSLQCDASYTLPGLAYHTAAPWSSRDEVNKAIRDFCSPPDKKVLTLSKRDETIQQTYAMRGSDKILLQIALAWDDRPECSNSPPRIDGSKGTDNECVSLFSRIAAGCDNQNGDEQKGGRLWTHCATVSVATFL